MPYRFVHSADIHLDSPLKSLAFRDPALWEMIGNATRRAFSRIVDLCLTEQVDALLLAGDLYDRDQTSMKTARFLADEMRRLHEAGIAVFIIRGNHDALSTIIKELVLPPSVKLFGGRAEAVAVQPRQGGPAITIHGLSFSNKHAPESLLSRYRPPVDGTINIGLMHTSLGGSPVHDPYAPCSPSQLHQSGFAYWALGHIHQREVLVGNSTIVMPGMPQGRDINEAGAKSATLVTIHDDGTITLAEHVTAVAQFNRVGVDLTGVEEWRDMVRVLGARLAEARQAALCEHLVARVTLTGVTPLAWRLRRDADLVRTEAESGGSPAPLAWIESVKIDCRPPDAAADTGADPLEELRRLVREEVLGSGAFDAEADAIAADLRSQLPPEARDYLGETEAEASKHLKALIREGTEDVMAWLHPGQGGEDAPAMP